MLSRVLGAPRMGIRGRFPKPLRAALLSGPLHNAAFPCKWRSLPGDFCHHYGWLIGDNPGLLGAHPLSVPFHIKFNAHFLSSWNGISSGDTEVKGRAWPTLVRGMTMPFSYFHLDPLLQCTLKKCTGRGVHPAHGLRTTVIATAGGIVSFFQSSRTTCLPGLEI